MSFDRKYLVWGLAYAAVGMGLGIFMAASHNHAQHVTHAHVLLVGFVVSLVYAVIHKLWLGRMSSGLAWTQFILHQVGVAAMSVGLLLLYGNIVPATQLEPILSVAAIAVLAGVLLMLFMVFKTKAAIA